jgi:DNA-binding IclR family transcriptional regulator
MAQVPAAARTIAVLRHLAGQSRPVAAAAIARDLDLPRSSTYHLLATLEEARFVTHLPEARTWALGPGAFELGQAYLHARPLARLARPVLLRLAHDTGIPAHLAVLDGREVVYVVTERPPQAPPLVVDVGVRLPAHLTASGRALLADQPLAQVRATFPDRASLPLRTGVGPRTPTELRRLLERVRAGGVGREDGEIDPRLASVAVTARDHAGRAEAAVTLTFVGADHDERARAALATRAGAAADRLTARLGG